MCRYMGWSYSEIRNVPQDVLDVLWGHYGNYAQCYMVPLNFKSEG